MDIFMRIQQNGYEYGKYVVNHTGIWKYTDVSEILAERKLLQSVKLESLSKKRIRAHIDGICLHYLIKEIECCPNYRRHYVEVCGKKSNRIVFLLVEPKQQIIDYKWNLRLSYLVYERAELEHALSWLSTLGGAFSALGDRFEACALAAGRISRSQLLLAARLGDAGVAARCRLYYGLSLIQRRRFALARRLVRREFEGARGAAARDDRLLRMCLGVWAKLRYEHGRARGRGLPEAGTDGRDGCDG